MLPYRLQNLIAYVIMALGVSLNFATSALHWYSGLSMNVLCITLKLKRWVLASAGPTQLMVEYIILIVQ